jgi:ubiquinone/menaquinone biosynthesis C-methylase UbiE
MNFWDNLMSTDEGAASYMIMYGEGPGCDTRKTISAFINDGESVLDVGCGPGWNFEHFRDYGPKVSKYRGEDYSPRFIRVASNRVQEPVFYLGDCRELRHEDNSWDVVILQDVLEHTNGYEKPLLEALRVAKKRVIVSMWHLVDDDNEHINDDGDDGYGAWYDGTVFKQFIDNLGYHWLETDSKPTDNRQHRFFIIDKDADV